MPRIDEVSFAKLVSAGKVYRAPLIVYPDSIDGRWWRKDGQSFSPEDFDAVLAKEPEVVVLGVGFNARVAVPEETKQRFETAGIELIIADTAEAVERYNALLDAHKKVVGAFHLM
ncbi:MAG: MTH938/NDUFAF3 family protein [Spirochaetaceae bacterium]